MIFAIIYYSVPTIVRVGDVLSSDKIMKNKMDSMFEAIRVVAIEDVEGMDDGFSGHYKK
jgi:hypothetical protein